jgi:hypothetical protein
MPQRDHQGTSSSASKKAAAAPQRRNDPPVLALGRAIGNRGMGQVLARKKGKSAGTLENSVRVGKLGPIAITDSNLDDWAAKKNPDDLVVTTKKGKHSDELKRLSAGKTRIETVEATSITGQNSWVKVTFRNARIKGYAAADDTESWTATDFTEVNIERLSIGKPRP